MRHPGDEAQPGSPQTGEDICPNCHGTGRRDDETCDTCGGSGRVVRLIGDA
jgi:DnaJ-class molecular chaperone